MPLVNTTEMFKKAYEGEMCIRDREGIHQVALTNAAYLSAWTDDWVSLPVDAAAYEKQLQARIAGTAKKASPTAGEAPSGQYSPRWNIRW